MKLSRKNIIIAIICLIIGFTLGMEYKAYQIRSALKDGLNEISEAFGSPNISNETNNSTEEIRIDKKIGDVIELATIKFKINSLEETNMLAPSFGSPIVASVDAKFLILDVDITNITKSPFVHYDNDLILLDDQERIFTAYSSIGNIENYIAGRNLAPNISENGKMVFEVSKDGKDYNFLIGKGGTNETYYIDLK